MSTDFYIWEINQESRFRKLKIFNYDMNFTNEKSKFLEWNGKSKECKKCHDIFPCSDYFYKLKGARGLNNICKECEGYKFSWGKSKKSELISLNQKYCQKCDTVYPLNQIFFNKNKYSDDTYTSYCKKCVSNCDFKINRHLNTIIDDSKEDYKICLECLYELPNNKEYYFGLCNANDGLEFVCKSCQNGKYGIIYIDKIYYSDKGTKCLSLYELRITNWLEKNEINFQKEVFYRDVIKNDNSLRRFDWVINNDKNIYYIEMFGLVGFNDYELKMNNKINICKENNLNLISIFPEDLRRPLSEVFSFLFAENKRVV